MILDPTADGADYTFESFKAELQRRLPLVPQMRKRLYSVPFNLGRPVWSDDPNFTIDNHLRRLDAPAPCGQRELAELVADVASQPMARDRPMWEWLVVEGLDDGRVAVITKYHHSGIDGFTGKEARAHLCDLEPGVVKEVPDEEWRPEPTPTRRQLLLGSLRRLPGKIRLLALIAESVRVFATGYVRRRRTPEAERISMKAPMALFNRAISARRVVSFIKTDLGDVKEIKSAFGVTVNDVVLAITGGVMRRYLEKHDALPDLPLIATVPIALHEVSRRKEVINRDAIMRASLGTDIADPVQRLQLIAESTRRAKAARDYIGTDFVLDWAEYFPANFLNVVARIVSSLKLADRVQISGTQNFTVSNVPGWFTPLYSLGVRIEAQYPFAQVMHGNGLLAAVLSNNGDMDWGFISCQELMPDIEYLAEAVPTEITELLSAARALG